MSLSRRGFLRVTYATTAAVTVVTVGQTFSPLKDVGLLAPRVPDIGPQGLPVNRTAKDAKVTPEITDAYRLVVDGPQPLELTLEELRSMPQHRVDLPIACVEGWSAMASWEGVRVRDLLDLAGVPHDTRIRVESLEQRGTYRSSVLDRAHARDSLTLLALKVRGQELHPDHGYPARLIAADRPGVLQTKWVSKLGPA
jgi:DMSO/TMAO reductase YedYZ molybdopterin-dependent catalytic subunit